MAILAITGDGLTKQMYEQLRKEVDWKHKHPIGLKLHAASLDNSGIYIYIIIFNSVDAVVQLVSDQSAAASEIIQNESLVVDNIGE